MSGQKDKAAKSLSDFTGMTITADDFVTNSKPKTVAKERYHYKFTHVNCDFVDFTKIYPNLFACLRGGGQIVKLKNNKYCFCNNKACFHLILLKI